MNENYPRLGHWIARTYDEQVEWWVGNLLYYTPEAMVPVSIETLKRLGPEMYMELMEKLAQARQAMLLREGYHIRHEGNLLNGSLNVIVSANGQDVGGAVFRIDKLGDNLNDPLPDEMWCDGIEIDAEHRRKGLATAIYVYAEKITSMKLIPSTDLSADALALWKQPNRPFGKPNPRFFEIDP